MDIRRSPATSRNPLVVQDEAPSTRGNAAWLQDHAEPGSVVFIGGAGLTDFRIRVAQSHLRNDMLPSFWSFAGIMTARGILTVPLASAGDPSSVPATNAVRLVRLQEFDDPAPYPNVGAIRFVDRGDAIVANAEKLIRHRSAVDLPTMLLQWLGFVWGAGTRRNPLLENVGLPGAAFVETAFGMAGIELTPGLSSGSSCPEAIWQSALWWHDYYRKTAAVMTEDGASAARATQPADALPRAVEPEGSYRCLQPAAAVAYEGTKSSRTVRSAAGRRSRSTAKRRSTKRSSR
jgi:hypothetical protein